MAVMNMTAMGATASFVIANDVDPFDANAQVAG
jgi:hypothetical protein